MTDMVIEVRGGTVVDVYCADDRVRTILVDWDEIGASRCAAPTAMVFPASPLLSLPEDTATACLRASVMRG